MQLKLKVLVVIAAAVASSSANAALITFDFTGGPASTTGGLTFTSGGVSVLATAWSYDSDEGEYNAGTLDQNNRGLGVVNAATDNSSTVDNSGWEDYVRFFFSPNAVTVRSVILWAYDDLDISYNFEVNADDWRSQNAGVGSNPNTIDLNYTELSRYFRLGAERGSDSNDSFRIAGIRVNADTRAVPEPTTLGLLGAGLICLGVATRRRRA